METRGKDKLECNNESLMSHAQQLEAKLLHAKGTYLQLLSTTERGGVGRDASQAIAELLNRRNSLLIGAHQCQSPPLISFIQLHAVAAAVLSKRGSSFSAIIKKSSIYLYVNSALYSFSRKCSSLAYCMNEQTI